MFYDFFSRVSQLISKNTYTPLSYCIFVSMIFRLQQSNNVNNFKVKKQTLKNEKVNLLNKSAISHRYSP